MDHYKTIIQNKMSKVESSLTDINNEVSAITKHLFELKKNCNAVVENLKKITVPATYLQEFVNVNSYLLKSLGFLTEINCKFEMLDISQKWVSSFISIGELSSSIINSELETKPKEFCESTEQLKFNASKTNPESVTNPELLQDSEKRENKESQQDLCNIDIDNNMNNNINSDVDRDNKKITNATPTNNNCGKSPELLSKNDLLSEPDTSKQKDAIKQSSETENKSIVTSFNNSIIKNASDSLSSGNVSAAGSQVSQIVDWWECADVTQIPSAESVMSSQEDDCQTLKTNNNENDLDDIKSILVRNVGEEYEITIENIKSPSEFYVSIKNQSNLLLEMEEQLKLIPLAKNHSNGNINQDKKVLLNKEIQNYALVYSKCDEMWCRAKIINWNLNFKDDFVSVFLLDYGEFKCVSIHDIQRLPDHLKEYPAFTLRCHLHDVFPVDLDEDAKSLSWGKDCTEVMRSVTETSNNIRMSIAPNDELHPSSSVPVTVFLVDQNKWVHDLLAEKKCAVLGPNLPKSPDNDINEEENLNNWNPMKEDFESYQNSYNVDINDPGTVIYGYVSKDYERICKYFAETGYCFKGKACRKEHSKLDPLGYTTDEEEIYKNAFNNLPIPPPNSVFNIQVTCVLNFNHFFCFTENVDVSSREETLRTLVKSMNKPENIKKMRKLVTPPSTGQIVIARYSLDNAWYRARILKSEPEDDCFKVKFVDYGNEEIRALSDIRAVEGRYLHLPFQGIECFIYGIERNPKKSAEETLEFLKGRMGDGQLRIEVIEKLPGEQVHLLVNVFDHKGRSIADILIAKEYAFMKEKEMLISSASESVPG